MSLLRRLAELRESGGRGVLFTVVEGDGVGGKALVVEDGDTVGDGVPEAALAQFDELVRERAQPPRRGRRRPGLRRVVRAAAAAARVRGGGHRRGALPRREAARLDGDRGRRARDVPDAGADALGRPAHPEVAAGGDRRRRARPPDGGRRPHPRRQVRRARADRGAGDGGVLHRRARLPPQPGAAPGAAARGGRPGGAAGADRRARAVSTSAPTRRRRRRSRSSPRSSPSAPTGRAARCARRSSGSTSRSPDGGLDLPGQKRVSVGHRASFHAGFGALSHMGHASRVPRGVPGLARGKTASGRKGWKCWRGGGAAASTPPALRCVERRTGQNNALDQHGRGSAKNCGGASARERAAAVPNLSSPPPPHDLGACPRTYPHGLDAKPET